MSDNSSRLAEKMRFVPQLVEHVGFIHEGYNGEQEANGLLLSRSTGSYGLENRQPSPCPRALQCAALTLVLKRPYGHHVIVKDRW